MEMEKKEKEEESVVENDKEQPNEVEGDKKGSDAKEVESVVEHSEKSSEAKAKSSSSSTLGQPPPPPPGGKNGGASKEIAKPTVPEVYPQVLALPITRRPLFPGFYKAVTINSPAVIKAVRELVAHGQPYLGAFLLKDSDSDSDVITSVDQVYPVGVFAQITSVFSSKDASRQPDTQEADRPETLTAVLYPHRRIRIDELVPAPSAPSPPEAEIAEPVTEAEKPKEEAEVASFEKEVPSIEETRKNVEPEAKEEDTPAPASQIGFLHPLVPEVSLTNVSNLALEPYKKDSQVVRAIMGEILAVFKEIAQLQPIFREQSKFVHSSPLI